MRFFTWDATNVYRAGSLTGAAMELARYELDLVSVQECRWDQGGTVKAGEYIFFYGKRNENNHWEQDFLYITEQYQQVRE